jgi:hypothetical protein
MYVVKDARYTLEGEGTVSGQKAIETSGSFSISVEKPDIYNSLARILKNTAQNIPSYAEAYAKFGIKDNIPPPGILMTMPALLEGTNLTGSTTVYIPQPIGAQHYSDPFPFDGASQLVGIYLTKEDWHPMGLKSSKSIDLFSHNCPLTNAFSLDIVTFNGQMDELRKSMPELEDMEIPDSDEINNLLNQAMNDMQQQLGNNASQGNGQISSPMDAYIELSQIMATGQAPAGSNAVVDIEIEGYYTKYYED